MVADAAKQPKQTQLACASEAGKEETGASEIFAFQSLRRENRRVLPVEAPRRAARVGIPPPPSSGDHGDGDDGDGGGWRHAALLRAEPAAGGRGRLRRRRRRGRGRSRFREAAEGAQRGAAPGAAAGDVDRGGGHARGNAAVHLLGDARQMAHRGPRLRNQVPHAPTGERTENRSSSLFHHRVACRLDWIQVKWLGFVSNLALKACVLDLKCEFLCSNCVSR